MTDRGIITGTARVLATPTPPLTIVLRTQERRLMPNLTHKTCEQCGVVFHRPDNYSVKMWTKRRFCSVPCYRSFYHPLSEKTCARCGKGFNRKYREGGPAFARRRYCSLSCAARSRGNPRYRKLRINGEPIQEHRHVMEQMLGRKLRPFETVHHKNGDRLDNQPSNLELWVSGHPGGQRVDDLIAFVVTNYPDETSHSLSQLLGPSCVDGLERETA